MTYLASAGHWSAAPPNGVALSDLLFTYIKGWGVQADSVGFFFLPIDLFRPIDFSCICGR